MKLHYESRSPQSAAAKVRSSLEMLLEAGVSIETRTTVHPEYHTEEQILQLARELSDAGIETYALQIYRQPEDCRRNIFLNVSEVTIRMKRL